jgi:predicted HicB family RNase H-like nuclease
MHNRMHYGDFTGSIEIDVDKEILYGKILYIPDSFSYHGKSVSEIKKAFIESVEAYLEICEEVSGEQSWLRSLKLAVSIR